MITGKRTMISRHRYGIAGLAFAVASIGAIAATATTSSAAWTDDGAVATSFTAVEPIDLVPELAGAGDGFTVLVASDGQVYSAGNNTGGRLGDGTSTNRVIPVRVALPEGTDIDDLQVGVDGTTVLDSTGTAWAWGGSSPYTSTPSAVVTPNGASVTAVDSGGFFSMVLTSDGTLYSWGNNGGGRLGQSGIDVGAGPFAVDQVDAVGDGFVPVGIDAGRISAGAWDASGNLRIWGSNSWGGASGVSITFTATDSVPEPTGIRDIAIATNAVFVVDSTGALWEVENGSTAATPMADASGLDIVDITTSFSQASLADPTADVGTFLTTSDGSLYAFGDNTYGQLGLSTDTAEYPAPTLVDLPGTPRIVVPGDQHSVLVTTDNVFYAAGNNGYGQFGIGSTSDSPTDPFTAFQLLYWPTTLQ